MPKRRSLNRRAAETFAGVYQEISGKKVKLIGENVLENEDGLRIVIRVGNSL